MLLALSELAAPSFTGTTLGIAALFLFVLAYAAVVSEDLIQLRKSKPVILAAGVCSIRRGDIPGI